MQAKNLVRNLDDRVTVKAYLRRLPSPYNDNRRQVLDLLNEYKAYAKETYILNSLIRKENGRTGSTAGRRSAGEVQVVKEDKFEVKRAFLGLVFQYEDKKEVLAVVRNIGSLEFDISSAIKRLTTRVKKRIGFTTGHQEPEINSLRAANEDIQKQYDIVPVDLSQNSVPIPQDIDALLIIAPQTKFSDSAKYNIDQYIMLHGGKVAFLLNMMNASLRGESQGRGPSASPMDIGLEDILENYGVRLNSDLVRDAQCANITVMQQQGPFQMQSQIPFPYLPNVTNVNKNNPLVKDLQGVIFYFVSSLDTSSAVSKGLNAEVLMRSSKQSGRSSGFIMIDPFHRYTPNEMSESGIPLAAIVSGSFTSFFEGKALAPQIAKSPATRIIVVGDGDFMKDDFAGSRSNITFFANIVDYLADDAGLITIRSKDIMQPPLEQVSDGMKKFIKFGDLFVPPLLVIGYGLARWRKRVAMKRAFEHQL